jgi:hypothetical protein
MNTQTPHAAVRHSIVVDAPVERAFSVFTHDFGAFEPLESTNLPSVEIAETVFEGRVGGNIYDREVEVRFVAGAPERTRVELEHRTLASGGLIPRRNKGAAHRPAIGLDSRGLALTFPTGPVASSQS